VALPTENTTDYNEAAMNSRMPKGDLSIRKTFAMTDAFQARGKFNLNSGSDKNRKVVYNNGENSRTPPKNCFPAVTNMNNSEYGNFDKSKIVSDKNGPFSH